MIMNDILDLGEENTAKILSELKGAANSDGDNKMFESIEALESMAKAAAKSEINNILLQD